MYTARQSLNVGMLNATHVSMTKGKVLKALDSVQGLLSNVRGVRRIVDGDEALTIADVKAIISDKATTIDNATIDKPNRHDDFKANKVTVTLNADGGNTVITLIYNEARATKTTGHYLKVTRIDLKRKGFTKTESK